MVIRVKSFGLALFYFIYVQRGSEWNGLHYVFGSIGQFDMGTTIIIFVGGNGDFVNFTAETTAGDPSANGFKVNIYGQE